MRVFQAGQGGTAGAPSPINYTFENYNRNKRSLTLDLSHEAGQKILHKLVESSDVFLNNLRPFEQSKFKIEYPDLSKINPRLVYASLNGYGLHGPDKDAPGYDQTAYWYRAGIPYVLTWPDSMPPLFQTALGDNVAGLGLAFGVMAALFMREKTGVGQEVHLNLFHLGVYVNSFNISGALATGQEYESYRRHSPEENPNPLVNFYKTGDGRWLNIVGLQPDKYWAGFCKAVGKPELEKDPRFDSIKTRRQNHVELYRIFVEMFEGQPLDYWLETLKKAGLPYSAMANLQEVCQDPQARANNFFAEVDHPSAGKFEVITNPIILSKDPATIRTTAPELGQNTEEILLELGYSWADIGSFRDSGVI